MPIRLSRTALAIAIIAGMGSASAATADDPAPANGKPAAAPLAEPAPVENFDPSRFGKIPDPAFGAFQRGLYITAFNLAKPRAEAGEAAAQTLLAEIYARGLGRKQNEAEAARWYGRAAEQSDPVAQFQYALLLVDGKYVEKDLEQAFALMEDSANAGNRLAQFNFAQMLIDRRPGPSGVTRAVGYYEKAAIAGLADAQYAMAMVYTNGAGDRIPNEAKARAWMQRAAIQNYDTAQLELGTWLVEGKGGEINEKAGFAWLKRAAESGNVAAQNRLAKLYRAGIGTEPNSIAAAAWYTLARRAGLVDPRMDIFLEGLTEEERRKAISQANRLR